MAYVFQSGESVSNGVRRIAAAELDSALEELAEHGTGGDERVHSVRKRMKKLRALLALVRPALGKRSYATENAAFRDAAKRLASAREAFVVLATFDDLAARHADDIAPAAFAELRTSLRAVQGVELDENRDAASELLRAARARLEEWSLDESGFDLIEGGLRRSYADARRAFRTAYARGDGESFHDWRKRAKSHWYHVRLFTPAWPTLLEALEGELHRLSELLGDEHDLADLEAALERIASPDNEGPRGVLSGLLLERRDELRREAQALGERLFAEPPKRLTRRMRRYFEAWQSDGARRVDEAHDAPDDALVSQDPHVT